MANTFAHKADRILHIYFKPVHGETFTKKKLAKYFIYNKSSRRYRIQATVQQTLGNIEGNLIKADSDSWIISAELFRKRIEMWLRSQGDYIVIVDQ